MESNNDYLKRILTELSKPLDYQWKLQSYTKDKSKAMCVAYIDARDVSARLNEVAEYGYHSEHYILGSDIYCKIGLIMPDGSVIWRSDVGESNNETEKSKTAASDSFKRAAVQFGIGRFLYDMEVVKLPTKQDGNYYNIVDEKGNKVWDLTKHIKQLLKKGGTKIDETPEVKEAPKSAKASDPKGVKPSSPVATKKKEELTPTHGSWSYAKKRISEGVKIEQIEETFVISEENKKLLTA